MVLTYESVDKILRCDHLNKTSLALLFLFSRYYSFSLWPALEGEKMNYLSL